MKTVNLKILEKARKILQIKTEILTCIKARICPECGVALEQTGTEVVDEDETFYVFYLECSKDKKHYRERTGKDSRDNDDGRNNH